MDCFVVYHSSLSVNTVHPKIDWILHKISLVGSLIGNVLHVNSDIVSISNNTYGYLVQSYM